MNEEEKLKVYLEKLKQLSFEKIKEKNMTALQALKESLNYVEGEMTGY